MSEVPVYNLIYINMIANDVYRYIKTRFSIRFMYTNMINNYMYILNLLGVISCHVWVITLPCVLWQELILFVGEIQYSPRSR